MTNNFIVIGVDFSTKRIDYSEWDDLELLLSAGTSKSISEFRKVLSYWDDYRGDKKYLAIEGVYHNRNTRNTIRLAEMMGRIKQVTEDLGFEVLEVSNDEWTKSIGCTQFKTDRKSRKQASCKIASAITKKEITDDNEADAINIGAYAVRKIKTQNIGE